MIFKDFFSMWLKSRVQGDEEKERYLWDKYRKSEGTIALGYGLVIMLVINLCYVPFVKIFNMTMTFSDIFKLMIVAYISGILLSWGLAAFVLSPLYQRDPQSKLGYSKHRDVDRNRLFSSTFLGYIAMIVLLYAIVRLFYAVKIVSLLTGIVYALICILLIIVVYPNILSYTDWRFNWALNHYDEITTDLHKVWTSDHDMEIEKINMKVYRRYKTFVGIILIVGPTLLGFCVATTFTYKDGSPLWQYKKTIKSNSTPTSNSVTIEKERDVPEEGSVETFYETGEMSWSIAPEASASVIPEASVSVAPEASDLSYGEQHGNYRLYYGRVSDPDGYNNIRREASLNSPITRRYNTGEYLYYTPMSNGWSKVYSAKSTSTFIGYMHTSRIVRVNKIVVTDMHRFIESKINFLKSRKLTEDDIRNYDSETMRLLRNSLFATHNYIFKSEDLSEFFSEYSWYSPLYKDVSSTFNQIELYNIGFLKEHE